MPDSNFRSAVAPKSLFYLAIDGTEARDSVAFGALLEKHRKWKNLASTYLTPASNDPDRLVDPAHPFLAIRVFEKHGRRIAVVCPNGTDGMGADWFWVRYHGEVQTDRGPVRGRYAAAELSAAFM